MPEALLLENVLLAFLASCRALVTRGNTRRRIMNSAADANTNQAWHDSTGHIPSVCSQRMLFYEAGEGGASADLAFN